MTQAAEARKSSVDLLTTQERECLKLVARHYSSKEIARELGISKASVDTYCNRARAKLGVADRREAARLVVQADGRAPFAPASEPVPPPAPVAPRVSLLPPVASMGPFTRLGLVVLGAALIAMVFSMLISTMQTLDAVVRASHRTTASAALQRLAASGAAVDR